MNISSLKFFCSIIIKSHASEKLTSYVSPLHYKYKKTSPDHTTSLEMTEEETDQELWLQILQSRSAELAQEHKQLSRTT